MNKIIEGFLKTHTAEYSLDGEEIEAIFEHFVNRCIVNKYVADRFNPDDIMTEPGEKGLDGVAIVVNDRLIMAKEDIDYLVKTDKDLSVNFVFIQAKTSESFSGSEIGDFIYGVKAFFTDGKERPQTNEKMEKMIALKDYVYEQGIHFDKAPTIEMFFVTCGKWNDDTNLNERLKVELKPLKENDNFSEVMFYPYDAEKLIVRYKELKKKISRSFVMDKRMTFPAIDGVTQAFIGTVQCKDFVKILSDSDANMLTNIFEDNVRDFQGYNNINKEIQKTILTVEDQNRFALLNNGITIVAKSIKITGDEVTLYDYQIVNGCQTSYVLFDNKDKLTDQSYIVVKLIEVNNEKVSDRVIYTTNRQTEVKSEAFTSINFFHKNLQDFYDSIELPYRLFYERRSKQYDLNDSVVKTKIITLATQIKAYLAVFLNEPHSTHRYYGELLEAYKSRLFLETDVPDVYYISSYLVYIVDIAMRRGVIPKKYRFFKYHIASAIKALIVGDRVIYGQGRKQRKEFEKIYSVVKDENEMNSVLKSALSCLEKAIVDNSSIPKEDLHRSKEITKTLYEAIRKISGVKNAKEFLEIGNTVQCVVTSMNASFVNVTIRTEDRRDRGSIHISKISNHYISDLSKEVSIADEFEATIIGEFSVQYGWEMSCIE